MAAGLILAAVLAIIAAWNRFTEPRVTPFNAAGRSSAVQESLEKLTPVEAWQLWVELYRPMSKTGFALFRDPNTEAINHHVAQRRFVQKSLLVTAGVLAAISLTVAFLWRTTPPTPRRR